MRINLEIVKHQWMVANGKVGLSSLAWDVRNAQTRLWRDEVPKLVNEIEYQQAQIRRQSETIRELQEELRKETA